MPAKRPPVFTSAVVVSHGPNDKSFVKAQVEDGSEIYLYPDDSGTLDLKLVPVGSTVEIRNVGFVDTPGPTAYKANAQHIELQNENTKAIFASRKKKNSMSVVKKKTPKARFTIPKQITVGQSDFRFKAIVALADARYGSKSNALSKITGDMVDYYLSMNSSAVKEAFIRQAQWEAGEEFAE